MRPEGAVNFKPTGPDATVFHLAEFFDCVRTRREPVENAEVGHYAAAAGHLVNLSVRSGKKMAWDSDRGTAREV